MLKVELHVHTNYSPDSSTSLKKLIKRCERLGINCLAITDHNTIKGALVAREIAPFPIIVGEEVKSSEGEITGLFLKEEIPPGLSALATARRIKDQGGLVSIPHPFDRMRRSVITASALEEILPYTDIVEVFNARNTFHKANKAALALAQNKGILMSAVSDAHTLVEIGRSYVEMPIFDGTPEGFKKSLYQGKLIARSITPLIHITTTFTKIQKRLLAR